MHQTAVAIESHQKHGEDRADIIESPHGLLIIVADGVGGQPDGAAAADLALSLIREAIPILSQTDWSDSFAWADLLTRIDQSILSNPEAGMTTCVVVVLPNAKPGSLVGASVGDSEAWIVTPSDWIESTEHQAKFGKSFLGRGDAGGVPFTGNSESGDTLVAATDGLFKYPMPIRFALPRARRI